MKKIFYIVLVIVALLVIAQFVKNNQTQDVVVEGAEVVSVNEAADGTVTAEDDAVVADDEGDAVESVDVVEENPSATASEDETIVNE